MSRKVFAEWVCYSAPRGPKRSGRQQLINVLAEYFTNPNSKPIGIFIDSPESLAKFLDNWDWNKPSDIRVSNALFAEYRLAVGLAKP